MGDDFHAVYRFVLRILELQIIELCHIVSKIFEQHEISGMWFWTDTRVPCSKTFQASCFPSDQRGQVDPSFPLLSSDHRSAGTTAPHRDHRAFPAPCIQRGPWISSTTRMDIALVPGLETHSWYLLRVPDNELKLRPSQHVADFPLSITRFTIPLRNWRECKTILRLEFTRPKRVAINLRFGKQD